MGPQPVLYNKDNTQVEFTWDIGTVRAQEPSNVLEVNLWNNKGGNVLVSDLKDAYISVLDYDADTAKGDVAKNKWVQIYVPSVDGPVNEEIDDYNNEYYNDKWTAIGGDTIKYLRANGITSDEYIISGEQNDGDMTNSSNNVCSFKLRIFAPPNSTAGQKLFKVKLNAYYS